MKMSDLLKCKKSLDKVSPTFCVAKWKQVTIHLESGLTHSCHHPSPHLIPLHELKDNVTALHNTNYKKSMRKLMLEGKIVPECEYCNRIERSSKDEISDRIYKSHEKWAIDQIPEIVSNSWDYDVFPTYLEVSFSGQCNCKCMYCSSTYSSSWVQEIKKYGAYPTKTSNRSFRNTPQPLFTDNSDNPYLKAFWKWWPDLYNKLRVFRITGGEPLLDKNTFEILDFVIDNIKTDLILDINSNLSISPNIFEKFIEKVKIITDKKMKFGLYTSCESVGKQTEYIRYGMNYNKWLDNCWKYLREVPFGELIVMSTFNILSITSFKDFLKDMLELKKEFPFRVFVDIPFLMNPTYLQANIITKDFLPYIEECITYMYKNLIIPGWPALTGNGFYDHEVSKLKRIYLMVKENPEDKKCSNNRKDFYLFINEYDNRRGTNFLETFPKYEKFYNECKNIED